MPQYRKLMATRCKMFNDPGKTFAKENHELYMNNNTETHKKERYFIGINP